MFDRLHLLVRRVRTGFRLGHSFTFAFLFIAALLVQAPKAGAQYLFNEMAGNRNSMAQGMVPGIPGNIEDSAWAIAQGDFNRDGRMDLAVVLLVQCQNPVSNCWVIQTYLGQADGSYALSATLSAAPGTSSLAVGDVNGDGVPDIVFASNCTVNSTTTVCLTTYVGKGDGTFQNAVNTLSLPDVSPSSIALGDFNRDGKLDAVISNNASVYLHLGNGDGTFSTGTAISVQQSPLQVLAADMNRDGKLDMVVSENSQIVSVILGNGDGTFAPETPYNAPGSNDWHIAVGDFNGDSIPDVVRSGNQINVYLGNGDGTLHSPIATNVNAGNPGPITTGDFNGDGITDIATAGGWTGVLLLFGNNDGTFRTPGSVYGNIGNDYASEIVAGDYNNDGKLDIATAPYFEGSGEAFAILANNGDGTFTVGGDLAAGTNPTSVVSADFNRDGIPDFAITNSNNGILVYIGQGGGHYGSSQSFSVGGNLTPLGIVAGDFNRDGKIDLATLNYSGSVSVLLGAGDGTFGAPKTYTGLPNSQAPVQMATGDLNGDGVPDLVILPSAQSTVSVLLGNPDGSFQAPYTGNIGLSWGNSLQLADVNGDGKLDLLVNGNGSGYPVNLQLLLGNGDGTFQTAKAAIPYTTPQDTGNPAPTSFGVGDLRGSGIIDLVTSGDGAIYVWPANGDGTFGQPIENYGVAAEGTNMVFGDFNGDGKTDLAMCGSNDAVYISLGNGDDTFGSQLMYNIPRTDGNSACFALVAGDFNGDGSLDLAGLTDSGTGSLTLMLSNPVLAFSSSSLTFPNTAIGSTATGIALSVTNQSPIPLSISGVSISGVDSGDFTQTNNCGASLAGGASCQVTVTFVPAAAGIRTASIVFTDSSAGSPQQIKLSGMAPGAGVTLSPASLSFGDQAVGSTSTVQSVTLSNTGTSALTISSITASGDFAQTNTCGTSLAAGASCSISVTFTPTAAGNRTGAIAITDNANTSPETVSLSGTGVSAAATLSPASVTFAAQSIGTSSAGQVVSLTNSGTLALTISSITVAGDFAQSNTCGTNLAAGASCSITVVFTPTVAGTREGTVSIVDNAPGSPQTVALSGSGQTATPTASLSPTSLTFASQDTASTSAAQTVTLTNSGTALSIRSIAVSGDFAQTNTCGGSVAAGAKCSISVTFTPSASGSRTGILTVSDTASGSPQAVSLSGTGSSVAVSGPSSGMTISSAGGSATATIQLSSAGGFSGTVSLACTVTYQGTGTPSDAPTCSLNPAQVQVSPTSGLNNSTLTVSTTASSSTAKLEDQWLGRGGSVLAALLLFGVVPRRRWRHLGLFLVLAIIGLGATFGCGGGGSAGTGGGTSPANPGTTAGSYVVTVSATSGTATASTQIPLSVR
jgi:FG-GAP-like repeat/Abnormal spindle-like microcephaly-assoc'd, ASPM-SPD-2-Hydin